MRIAVSIAKSLAGLFALAMLAGLAWLWISPPDLIRLGSSYAAKIICSNAPAFPRRTSSLQANGR
jgi:hypothetical protein